MKTDELPAQGGENEVERCRRARETVDRRFKTLEEHCAYLEKMTQLRKRREAKARRTKTARSVNSKRPPAPVRRPAHKS